MKILMALYRDRRFITLLCLGFVSGLPFLLTLSTLSFWLSELGISKSAMSLILLTGTPYSVKFLWAPFLDHLSLPFLSSYFGNRRAWALVAQVGIMISLFALSWIDPLQSFGWTCATAFCISFCAATLDSVVDAYRIELLEDDKRALGASVESIGFRCGMLTSGAGALYLAEALGWQWAYAIMAFCMLLGIFTILLTPLTLQASPRHHTKKPQGSSFVCFNTMIEHFKKSFATLIHKNYFIPLLIFIFCFKGVDTILNAMSAPFLYELGVTKIEFADISKVFGVILMVCGALLGGIFLKYLGDLQGVILALILQIISALMFTLQAIIGHHMLALIITVGVESFTSGFVSTVFIAYLSKFCSSPHTAAHFTALYSFGSLCRVLTSSSSAFLSDLIPWSWLFCGACLLTLPGFYLIFKLEKDDLPFSSTLAKIRSGFQENL